jgi:hypothetical protein
MKLVTWNTLLLLKQNNLILENNMLVYLTDALSGGKIAINPEYVVALFTLTDGEHKGKTNLILVNSNILLEEDELDVYGLLNGIKND